MLRRGCSAVLMGQMMYFGGFPNTDRYSIIIGEKCRMKENSVEYEDFKMPFHFYDGACNSFMGQTRVLLCFSSDTLPDVGGCHM